MQENLNENVQLVNREYGSTIGGRRSLRLRAETYNAATTRQERFLLSKLEKAEKNLVNSTYQTSDFHHDYGKESKVEKDVEKKSRIVAKLEEKLDFIPKETYDGENYVDARAIKLKKKMMDNLIYHVEEISEGKFKHEGYIVPEEAKIGFFEPEVQQPVVEAPVETVTPAEPEEEIVTREEVEQAVAEAAPEESVAEEETTREAEVVITPDREEIKNIIEETFEAVEEKPQEENISIVYPAAVATKEEPKIEVEAPVETEEETVTEMTEPSQFIAEQLNKISKNGERKAKIEENEESIEKEEINREQIKKDIVEAMEKATTEENVVSSDFTFGFEEEAAIEEAVVEHENNESEEFDITSKPQEEKHSSDIDALKDLREKLSLIQRKEQEMEEELTKADESVEMAEKEYEAEEQRVREYLEERNAQLAAKEQNYHQRMEENARREKEISERRAILAEIMNLSSDTKESESSKTK